MEGWRDLAGLDWIKLQAAKQPESLGCRRPLSAVHPRSVALILHDTAQLNLALQSNEWTWIFTLDIMVQTHIKSDLSVANSHACSKVTEGGITRGQVQCVGCFADAFYSLTAPFHLCLLWSNLITRRHMEMSHQHQLN